MDAHLDTVGAQEEIQQATDDADDERAANRGPETFDMESGDDPTDKLQHHAIDDQREEAKREDVDGQRQDEDERTQVGIDQRQDQGGDEGGLLVVEPDFMKYLSRQQQRQRVDREFHQEDKESIRHGPSTGNLHLPLDCATDGVCHGV